MHPKTIQKLIDLFAKFPTVGPRTAARFTFYLLKLSKEEIETLTSSISKLKDTIKTCKSCFSFFEPLNEEKLWSKKTSSSFPHSSPSETLCRICQDTRRDKTLLCIVEKETDLIPIEKTKKYNGLYLILGGLISAFKGEDKGENEALSAFAGARVKEDRKILRTNELLERAKNSEELKEIIIALNSTGQGQTTALYLERLLKKNLPDFHGRVTRLGQGLPRGAELEYADEETLSSALEGRK